MGVISCGTTMIDQGEFQNLDIVSWDTTAKTANFTAVAGNGYFVNTTSGAITVTLPASPSAGDQVAIKDYAATAETNNILIARNGSNISGDAGDVTIAANGVSVLFLYVDATQGWSQILTGENLALSEKYVAATGGTITTSGDFKIHTFTGPGTFTVTCAGSPIGSDTVDYLVVAGGGGGGGRGPAGQEGGGAGAGGYRESSGAASGCYATSPLGSGVSALPVSATGYPITVGSGGAGGVSPGPGSNGANSIFSTITSAGGGGAAGTSPLNGNPGGSGGGANGVLCGTGGGSGNQPFVTPPQGNNGGPGTPHPNKGGGGGGATQAGTSADGGDGGQSSINGSATYRAGGGGGAPGGTGGQGGGANGDVNPGSGSAGTANTGGGGSGGLFSGNGGAGGSGIVIIRYKFQ